MPIEIRELVIRATVEAQQPADQSGTEAREQDLEEIVAQCVEQVLEVLGRSKER